MINVLKNYKSSFILLFSVIVGGILGILLGPKAAIFEPFGNLFINLMLTLIVPLVFFSISSAIANMAGMKRLGKIIISLFLVFIFTSIIAAALGVLGASFFNPTKGIDVEFVKGLMLKSQENVNNSQPKLLQQIVDMITVNDFSLLLSRKNMIQLIMFSLLFGVSVSSIKEKGKPIADLLESGSKVMTKLVSIVMKYAPIGLGCYFASIVGQLGGQIVKGYLRVFILYIGISIVYYFVVFSLYAYISGGKNGIKVFWQNAIVPSITALATCSSAASIPVNIEFAKKMGISKDIAETSLPLGANMHKDGSVIGGVMKIVFLMGLFGKDMNSISAILGIFAVSFLVGTAMAAIPGGGLIGEMLIISIYGFSPMVLPIIAVISTIIDAPATLLNSVGNIASSMMVSKLVDGKEDIQLEVNK